MTRAEGKAKSAHPVGLIEGGKVIAPIKKGELITTQNATPDASLKIVDLRRAQDELLGD